MEHVRRRTYDLLRWAVMSENAVQFEGGPRFTKVNVDRKYYGQLVSYDPQEGCDRRWNAD